MQSPQKAETNRLIDLATKLAPDPTSLDVRFSVQYFLDVQLFADSVTQPTPLMWCAVHRQRRRKV